MIRSPAILVALLLAACGPRPESAAPARDPRLAAAEAYIDAFYSFDPSRLRAAMASAESSIPRLLFYQSWAQGGNYVVLERRPCQLGQVDAVTCEITVRDDLIAALGTGSNVTDTFHLSFREGRIVSVRTTSNDPPEFEQALQWLAGSRPELLEGPCRGFFDGGPTPQDCVRAVVRGFADWRARPGR